MRRERRGFTLIEMVVALAVFAIVAAMAIPIYTMTVTRTKQDETRLEMVAIKSAIESYYLDCWKLPPTLAALSTNSGNVAGWNGPYLVASVGRNGVTTSSITADAWNTAYYYVPFAASPQITLRSYGPDRLNGTSDDILMTIELTWMRRMQTVDELKTLNTAITAYNAKWLASDPLVPPLATILSKLNARGFLPTPYDRYLTDGWASAYVESPAGASPVVKVVSTHTGL